ncbi:MAG: circadian clock KaiB family protein [Spirochaetaceae bacterium]
MSANVLKLFVTGRTKRSQNAVRSVRALLAERPDSGYELQVIDVLENPEEAEADRILATPTLLKEGEGGGIRLIGDLSNREQVTELLGLHAGDGERPEERDGEQG